MEASAIKMQSASKEMALLLVHARQGSLAMGLYAVISMTAEIKACVVSAICAFFSAKLISRLSDVLKSSSLF